MPALDIQHQAPIAFRRFNGARLVARPTALDSLRLPIFDGAEALALRFAPDELYITPADDVRERLLRADPHAIVIADDGFSGAWVAEAPGLDLLARYCEWRVSGDRPGFCQGAVAGVATKLVLLQGMILFLTLSPYAHELENRLR